MGRMYGYREIARITNGEVHFAEKAQGRAEPAGVSIDTRRLEPGEVFFAIRGANRDGHDFVEDALRRGAGAAVVSKAWLKRLARDVGGVLIGVADPLVALQDLSAHYRRSLRVRVAGVAGSNGKTTTKEMAARILSRRYRTAKTEGNLNNHLGVPLTLLGIPPDAEVAVVEMGMNHLGEIRRLSELSDPEVGVVTNVGASHLEFLGSMENVLRAKGELVEYLAPDGTAVLNADDPWLAAGRLSIGARILTFGIERPADVRATDLAEVAGRGARFTLSGRTVQLAIPGREFVYDALAAVAAGIALGVREEEACDALEGFRPFRMRMETIRAGGVTVVNDAYNANPASVAAAIEELRAAPAEGRRVLVIGDMHELGEFAGRLHRQVGRRAARAGINLVWAIGEHAGEVERGCRSVARWKGEFHRADSTGSALTAVPVDPGSGDVVLVKGSRLMRLERICDRLVELSAGERVPDGVPSGV